MSQGSTCAIGAKAVNSTSIPKDQTQQQRFRGWKKLLPPRKAALNTSSVDRVQEDKNDAPVAKWCMGILNDRETEAVPGW